MTRVLKKQFIQIISVGFFFNENSIVLILLTLVII